MPWFNVDDGFSNSKPVLRIPRRYRCTAIGLWTLAGSWSAKELTDGFIPDHTLEEFASTTAMAGFLVRAGLWREVVGGWQFEGWEKWQKTKEQVLAFRAAEAERKRKARSEKKPSGSSGASGVDSARTEPGVPLGHHPESGQPLPEPLPIPKPSFPLADLGGGVTSVDANAPRPQCPNHETNYEDGVCRPCMKRRQWDEANSGRLAADELEHKRAAKADAARALQDCQLCDSAGWILGSDGTIAEPARHCTAHNDHDNPNSKEAVR